MGIVGLISGCEYKAEEGYPWITGSVRVSGTTGETCKNVKEGQTLVIFVEVYNPLLYGYDIWIRVTREDTGEKILDIEKEYLGATATKNWTKYYTMPKQNVKFKFECGYWS